MKRSGFTRPQLERKRAPLLPGTGRGVHAASSDVPVTVPKESPVRSEAYRRLVASLPCWMCRASAPSQCAHVDFGKGAGIKACDLQTFPLCADRPGRVGCHTVMGATGTHTKDIRRHMERAAVRDTQNTLLRRYASEHDVAERKVLRDVGLLP